MAYDETLAQRIRQLLAGQPGLAEKKMFGGIGFLLHGNMACGVIRDTLITRVGPERYEESLELPHAHVFDMTGPGRTARADGSSPAERRGRSGAGGWIAPAGAIMDGPHLYCLV